MNHTQLSFSESKGENRSVTARWPKVPIIPKESQNHRLLQVRRDLCRSSGPTPLFKQGHLDQMALEYLQGWRLHSFSGQVCQSSVTLTAFQMGSPSMYLCLGLLLPALPLLKCLRFLSAHLQPLEVALDGSTTLWCVSHPTRSVPSAKLLRVHFAPSSRS